MKSSSHLEIPFRNIEKYCIDIAIFTPDISILISKPFENIDPSILFSKIGRVQLMKEWHRRQRE